jgi:hypothetical protein
MIKTILGFIKFFVIAVPLACFLYVTLFLIAKMKEYGKS